MEIDVLDQRSIDAAKKQYPGQGVGPAVAGELVNMALAGKFTSSTELPSEYQFLRDLVIPISQPVSVEHPAIEEPDSHSVAVAPLMIDIANVATCNDTKPADCHTVLGALQHAYAIGRVALPGRDDELLADLLTLVDIHVPLDVVARWTENQYQLAHQWAHAAYLRASDNDTVTVPERPEFLAQHAASQSSLDGFTMLDANIRPAFELDDFLGLPTPPTPTKPPFFTASAVTANATRIAQALHDNMPEILAKLDAAGTASQAQWTEEVARVIASNLGNDEFVLVSRKEIAAWVQSTGNRSSAAEESARQVTGARMRMAIAAPICFPTYSKPSSPCAE